MVFFEKDKMLWEQICFTHPKYYTMIYVYESLFAKIYSIIRTFFWFVATRVNEIEPSKRQSGKIVKHTQFVDSFSSLLNDVKLQRKVFKQKMCFGAMICLCKVKTDIDAAVSFFTK